MTTWKVAKLQQLVAEKGSTMGMLVVTNEREEQSLLPCDFGKVYERLMKLVSKIHECGGLFEYALDHVGVVEELRPHDDPLTAQMASDEGPS